MTDDDDGPVHHVCIVFDLPAWPGTNALVAQVVFDVLDRLERDGLRPYRTTIDITELATR